MKRKTGLPMMLLCTLVLAIGCADNGKEVEKATEQEKKNENISAEATLTPTNTVTPNITATPTPDPDEALPYVEGKLKRVSVHDPSILVYKGEGGEKTYYIYGTHISGARSKDLANWMSFTNGYATRKNTLYGNLAQNLESPFSWAGDHDSDCKNGFAVWAPHIIYNKYYVNEDGSKGAYMDYFCTSSTYCRSAIGFAVSDKVDSGFVCKGTLVCSGFTPNSAKDKDSNKDKIWTNTNIDELIAAGRLDEGFNNEWKRGNEYNTDYAPNAIDPAILFDKDGRMWMAYGSWSGGIYMLELDRETGEAIYPKSNGKTEDGRVIDKYFGIRIAGGHTKSGEGPFIVYDENTDYYYLLTTYNYLDAKSGYNMRLFRSKTPTGPYVDAKGNNAVFASKAINMYDIGIKVMGNYKFSCLSNGYRSPGHCSAFIDDDGQMYLIYHTRFETGGERFEVRVHQQFMNEQGWPVTAVFENRGDKISKTGYPEEQILGEYEFINHGIGSDGAAVKSPVSIVLSDNGNITGDVTGKWVEKEGSCMATFTIGDVKYHGVFFKQHNEASTSKLVMTFTAVGENNETIWGVKKY